MRYLFLFTIIAFMACNSADNKTAETKTEENKVDGNNVASAKSDSTTIQWLDPLVQELGKANEGQVLDISWRFKNTGDKPLIFSEVRAGCGCTVADKPEEPVAPGKEGVIKARFDTKGQLYSQHKSVYVHANNTNKTGAGEDVLGFKVEVAKQ